MPDWLDRYRSGQRDEVWHELRQMGSGVRDPALAAQAQSVCDEMARLARQNLDVIIARLAEQGYRFHENDNDQTPVTPHHAPSPGGPDLADWLVARFGPVPMTLLSWVRLVGDVWLVGSHPIWSESAAADPLVIEVEGTGYPGANIRRYFEEEFDAWRENHEGHRAASPFVLPLAPDRLHKDNVSGGPPYGMILPDTCADGLFVAGDMTMPFVSYLNWTFSHGGFPWPTGSKDSWRVTQQLKADLEPL